MYKNIFADAVGNAMSGAAYLLLQGMKCNFGHKTPKHVSIFVFCGVCQGGALHLGKGGQVY